MLLRDFVNETVNEIKAGAELSGASISKITISAKVLPYPDRSSYEGIRVSDTEDFYSNKTNNETLSTLAIELISN